MAEAGDELVNQATGLRTVFRETAQSTAGELLQVDWIARPEWTTGPDHVHPRQEERFEVLSGRLGLRAAGAERDYGAGDVIVVPAGVSHAAWNAGDEDVHVLVDFRPALRTEFAFETLAGLARDGMTTAAGIPRNPLRLALVLREFEDEIYFVRPSLALQRAIWAPWPSSRVVSDTELNTPTPGRSGMRALDRAPHSPVTSVSSGRPVGESRIGRRTQCE
jgi:quercetin dioxygenase-like cupin family protein